jgi:patatin-like phospholipase/acyl hydrolase
MKQSGFRILSLDGGGIRGAFGAALLAEIERRTTGRLADYFDLICGASTGAIIAIALALGESAERIEQFYSEKGPSVFVRDRDEPRPSVFSRLAGRLLRRYALGSEVDAYWLTRSKYKPGPLKSALEEFFGERKIGQASRRLAVPAVDLVKGQTVVFKTSHLPGLVRDSELLAVDVAMAACAAPSYFPPSVIGKGSAYADGGLWASNPALIGFAEAIRIHQTCNRPGLDHHFELPEISMLSIGTGQPTFFMQSIKSAGLLFWASRPLEVTSATQSQGVHFAAKYILANRYKRIDFTVPNGTVGAWNLDSTELTPQLIHIGAEKAVEELNDIKQLFLSAPAPPHTPFS